MAKNSLKTRIILMLVIFNLLVFGFFYWNSLMLQRMLVKDFEEEYIAQTSETVAECVRDAEREARILSNSLFANSTIKEAFMRQDREELLKLTSPVYEQWQKDHHISQLNFFSAEGKAILRAQKPEQYGDDVSYRKALAKAIQTGQQVMAAEKGVTGFGIRCLTPLVVEDRLVGI